MPVIMPTGKNYHDWSLSGKAEADKAKADKVVKTASEGKKETSGQSDPHDALYLAAKKFTDTKNAKETKKASVVDEVIEKVEEAVEEVKAVIEEVKETAKVEDNGASAFTTEETAFPAKEVDEIEIELGNDFGKEPCVECGKCGEECECQKEECEKTENDEKTEDKVDGDELVKEGKDDEEEYDIPSEAFKGKNRDKKEDSKSEKFHKIPGNKNEVCEDEKDKVTCATSDNSFVKLSEISPSTRKKVYDYWKNYLGYPEDYCKLLVKNH